MCARNRDEKGIRDFPPTVDWQRTPLLLEMFTGNAETQTEYKDGFCNFMQFILSFGANPAFKVKRHRNDSNIPTQLNLSPFWLSCVEILFVLLIE